MTPRLDDWTVTALKRTYVPPTGSLVQCESCHNTHKVAKGSGVWDVTRLSNPTNTKLAWTGTVTDFCLTCHQTSATNGQTYARTRTATTLVAYDLAIRPVSSQLWPGWSKTAVGGIDFKTSGHFTTSSANRALCENCHDPHGSDSPELTAYTPATGRTVANSRLNTGTASREENLCYKCHNSGSGSVNGRYMDVQTPNGAGTYGHQITNKSLLHSDEETVGQLATVATRHVECADCHDPHAAQAGTRTVGTSTAGLVTKGAYGIVPPAAAGNFATPTAADYATIRLSGASTDLEAYLCFKCHAGPGTPLASVTTSSSTYMRTDLGKEFNPNNFSFHNVLGLAKAVGRNANAGEQYMRRSGEPGTQRHQVHHQPHRHDLGGLGQGRLRGKL